MAHAKHTAEGDSFPQAAAAHTVSCVDPYHLINNTLLTTFSADSHVYKAFLPAFSSFKQHLLIVDKKFDCGLLFARWDKLATLEFDRNRKSMSVIACAAQPASSTASGVTTRSSSKNSSSSGNVLFVKGAAEYMLNRCSKVCLLAHYMLCHACFAEHAY